MLQPGVHDQRAEAYRKPFRNFMVQEFNHIAESLINEHNGNGIILHCNFKSI